MNVFINAAIADLEHARNELLTLTASWDAATPKYALAEATLHLIQQCIRICQLYERSHWE